MGVENGGAGTMNALVTFFAYPWAWSLLSVVPILWWLLHRRDRERLRLAREVTGLAGLQCAQRRTVFLQRTGLLLAASLTVIASSGPQWGYDPKQPIVRGRDLIIALDISRSMLAEDRPDPAGTRLLSRLQRSKQHILALLEMFERRGGHRIGLVWFAGQARLVCPLTDDYDHIRALVELAHPDYWGPAGRLATTEQGAIGTSLRQALITALAAFDPQANGFQDILLVTDGDDQDADPAALAKQAHQRGIRIHVLGVGNSQIPAHVPAREPGRWLEINGQPVTTRRHDAILLRLAQLADGLYLPEEDYRQPTVHWFTSYLERQPQRLWSPLGPPRPLQHSTAFFLIALVLLLIALA